MFADILIKGNQLSGNDGWFRKATSQTRFGQKAIQASLDKNGDGLIARGEFSGSDRDFARLDRDHDGVLSTADFDFKSQTPTAAAASLFSSKVDRNRDGKITRQEIDQFFQAIDAEGLGFITQEDLQETFTGPASSLRERTGGPGSLTRSTFLKSFLRSELGAFPPGPGLNTKAPDFTLRTIDGREEITLSKLVGPKPVVLVFGNVTCGPFRAQAGSLEKLAKHYQDRAKFLMVYVREAHPTDGWRMVTNDRLGIAIRQPQSYRERVSAAQVCSERMALSFPIVVDTLDDSVNNLYSGIPSRLYLIDRQGNVAFKSGRGPFGFKPAELEQSLLYLLNQDATEGTPNASRTSKPGQNSQAVLPRGSEE